MAQHLVGLLVVVRNVVDVEGRLTQADQLLGLLDHRQRLEAEEVELHQPGLLDIFHVELGGRNVGPRIAVERHQFFQRAVADDDACGVGGGVAVEALELQGEIEQGADSGVLVALFLQLGLAVDGLRKRHRIGRVVGDQLREPVHLAIGHLQHATHIARDHAGLQLAEGDDLRHAVTAIALLHIGDDLAAPVLAEVDVEVRHRHALGVEEALEQQVEAERVEVGDGEHIGHHGTGTRATAGAHRNAVGLRIADEVRHDQEVAGELHLGDDVELKLQALFVFLADAAFDEAARGKALFQPGMGLPPQLFRLVIVGKARQDGIARLHAVGAAQGDLDGVLDRFRHVGEQGRHFLLALEIMLGCQPATLLGDQHFALGDADQCVMGRVVVRLGKVGFVGGNKRHFELEGEIDEPLLRLALGRRAVPLEFDVEAIAEHRLETFDLLGGKAPLASQQRVVDGTLWAAGEADEACRMRTEIIPGDVVLGILRAGEIGPRGELHQVLIPLLVLGEKGERRDPAEAPYMLEAALLLLQQVDPQGAADDRLDALVPDRLRELERTEEVAGVGDRHRRHLGVLRQAGERLDLECPLGQRIGCVGAQVDKDGAGLGHGGTLAPPEGRMHPCDGPHEQSSWSAAPRRRPGRWHSD